MGQQQLLLMVLAIVLVGGAVAIGIGLFEERSAISKRDRQVEFMVEFASRIRVWSITPAIMGGGDRGGDTRAMGFGDLGWTSEPGDSQLHMRKHVGCAYVFPVFNGGSTEVLYRTARVYDLDACPASNSDLDDEDMSVMMRVYEDEMWYRVLPSFRWNRTPL